MTHCKSQIFAYNLSFKVRRTRYVSEGFHKRNADQIVPLSSAKRTAQAYPYAELVVLPGEGHGFSEDAIGGVIERSLAFLSALL